MGYGITDSPTFLNLPAPQRLRTIILLYGFEHSSEMQQTLYELSKCSELSVSIQPMSLHSPKHSPNNSENSSENSSIILNSENCHEEMSNSCSEKSNSYVGESNSHVEMSNSYVEKSVSMWSLSS